MNLNTLKLNDLFIYECVTTINLMSLKSNYVFNVFKSFFFKGKLILFIQISNTVIETYN